MVIVATPQARSEESALRERSEQRQPTAGCGYSADIGLTGDDVDGVVGDQTWSALLGHTTLDARGTDGYRAGTYVDHGRHLRFDPTDMGYMNGVANEADKLYMRVIIVGDVDVPSDSVVPTVHVEGPNGTTNPNQFSYYPGTTGPGGWFQIIVDEATNHGPAGRYRVIAQLRWTPGATRSSWSSTAKFLRPTDVLRSEDPGQFSVAAVVVTPGGLNLGLDRVLGVPTPTLRPERSPTAPDALSLA